MAAAPEAPTQRSPLAKKAPSSYNVLSGGYGHRPVFDSVSDEGGCPAHRLGATPTASGRRPIGAMWSPQVRTPQRASTRGRPDGTNADIILRWAGSFARIAHQPQRTQRSIFLGTLARSAIILLCALAVLCGEILPPLGTGVLGREMNRKGAKTRSNRGVRRLRAHHSLRFFAPLR
jgi:hypothetical protein